MRNTSRVLSAAIGIAMVCGLSLVGSVPAKAVTASAMNSFIASVVAPAQAAQRKFGVPSSVSIAQAVADSDWGTSAPAKQAKNYFDTKCSASMAETQYAQLADAQVGKPYVLGANGPERFDCSSLVIWLNNKSGAFRMSDDTAAGMYNRSRAVKSSPKAGDMVFLRNNPARSNGIGHMAVLTQKLADGDWRIIEARGRAYGVVRSTLSYWKQRSYYAGLRRLAKLVFANTNGVTASAASMYQTGCVTISSDRYARFSSMTDSFYAHAAAVVNDSAYRPARAVINSVGKYVTEIAKVEHPKDAATYARTINGLIDTYHLTDYDVIPFDIVLTSGDKGAKVASLQHLLAANGTSVKASGAYDSATVSAVKKYQAAKKLEKDGEAGPKTLTRLFAKVASGATGSRVQALHTLLAAFGPAAPAGSTFGTGSVAALKAFQATAGRSATGVADANTWALLFMTPDQAPAPTVAGTTKVTQTLTASVAKWGPGTYGVDYQWYRAGAPVSGATAATYTLQPADAGATMTVAVTGTRPGYTTIRRTSATTAAIAKAHLTATPTPKVTGKATVGQSLNAVPGTWSPDPVTPAYQWYRGATAIPGATAVTYPVQGADAGAKLKVVVTGNKAGYVPVAVASAVTATVAKGTLAATPTPKISGTPKTGATLTAVPGAWAPAPDALAYQWYRGKTAIKGATGATYVLTGADAKASIKVRVTGAKAGYDTVATTSAATAKVTAAPLTMGKPKISGTAKVGKTLTAAPGTWGPGTVKLSYRWYNGGRAIKGATEATYKLKSADKGDTISVKVTGRKAGFTSATVKASVKIKK